MLKQKYGQSTQTSAHKFQCSKCYDTGWIEERTDDGARIARKCACQLAKEAEQRLRASGLQEAVKRQTFDSFRTDTELQSHMKLTAQDYLQAVLDPADNPRRPWLYVGGNPGSGKTHICTAVCGEILRHNIGVRYMQWLNESKKLKFSVNAEDFEDHLSPYIGASVLYIDDLLKQKYSPEPEFTEADIRIAFTILNARYIQNKPTIISSEWDLIDQLLPADEGVFSRVYERSKGFLIRISRDTRNNYRMRQAIDQ